LLLTFRLSFLRKLKNENHNNNTLVYKMGYVNKFLPIIKILIVKGTTLKKTTKGDFCYLFTEN